MQTNNFLVRFEDDISLQNRSQFLYANGYKAQDLYKSDGYGEVTSKGGVVDQGIINLFKKRIAQPFGNTDVFDRIKPWHIKSVNIPEISTFKPVNSARGPFTRFAVGLEQFEGYDITIEMEEDADMTIKKFSQYLQARIFDVTGMMWPPRLTAIDNIKIIVLKPVSTNRGGNGDYSVSEEDKIAEFSFSHVFPTTIPSTNLIYNSNEAISYTFGFRAHHYDVKYYN